jgi:predicted kinase
MRKWMSERLKRRKKPADASTSTKEVAKGPEPLQPRFYDDEPSPTPAASAEVPAAASRQESRSAPEPAPEPIAATGAASAASAAESGARSIRRRRSRGGRGRSRQRPAAAASSPAVEASTPEPVPGEAGSDQAVATPAADTQAASTVAAPATTRPSKGTVVLAIGLPGSGKSSWFKRHNIHPLSSDLLRELLFDDAQEQRFQDLVFSNLRSMLKARLIARRPMNYVDATNLTPHDRHSWIKLAKDYGYDVQGVFFDVPLEVCMERHQRRGRVVPEEIMRKMAGKLRPPTFEEGFSKITVVRVKQKEAAAG